MAKNSLIEDFLEVVPSFWRAILFPRLQKAVEDNGRSATQTLALMLFSSMTYVVAENISQKHQYGFNSGVLTMTLLVAAIALTSWIVARILAILFRDGDENISSSSMSFSIVTWVATNLAIVALYFLGRLDSRFEFENVLVTKGGKLSPCSYCLEHARELDYSALLYNSFMISVLSFIFMLTVSVLFRKIATKSVLSVYSEMPDIDGFKYISWMIALLFLNTFHVIVFHFLF